MSSLLLLVLAVTATATAEELSHENDFRACTSKMSTMEKALYETEGNVYQLNIIFYPPSMRTTRFIRVIYTFLNELGEDDGCNVTYIWAIGGFLFFQPPTLFMFNSLFFNYPNNNLTNIHLRLPYECKGLIQEDAHCSCVDASQRLEVLTQQLNIYAQFSSHDQVARENTFARAICSEELEHSYYSNHNPSFVFVIFCSTTLVPLFTLLVVVGKIRGVNESNIRCISHSENHKTVVALTLIGTIFSVGVLISDVLACQVVMEDDHEFSPDVRSRSINLYIVFVTLIFDILFTIPLVSGMLYITVCVNGRRVIERVCCKMTCSHNSCVPSLLVLIIGKGTYDKACKDNAVSFAFLLMLTSPALCFSSHLSYILLAWLTEPAKCTTALILYYLIILYFFVTFRKCYKRNSGLNLSCDCLENSVVRETRKDHLDYGTKSAKNTKDASGHDKNGKIANNDSEYGIEFLGERGYKLTTFESAPANITKKSKGAFWRLSNTQVDDTQINTQAFCLMIFYSVFIVGTMIMFMLIFLLLPLASQELIVYLFELFQLIVVLVSTQFAYKLFFSSSFSFESVVQKFKEVYAERGANGPLVSVARDKEELEEVAGEFAVVIADAVISKNAP